MELSDNSTGKDLFNKAISKYGKEFEAIFAIMPEEILIQFLNKAYKKGIIELNKLYSDYKADREGSIT
jgi:hypothetical protein